ncbi:MAG: cytochrome b/b6 domain-containing protein [Sphingomonas sp.]|nr:cytochrome b/b6 domain-containing protein [Sphingomonas sp.]
MRPNLSTEAPAIPSTRRVERHRLSTRVWHWANALTVFLMLMSGLMIFNAHPRLYWGQYGANADPAWLEIGSTRSQGYARLGSMTLETTGVLGLWTGPSGTIERRAFPGWMTIPSYYSLAGARRWHLAFAWILAAGLIAHWIASLFNKHLSRDLAASRGELTPRHLWQEIADHARLRFARGDAALRYNTLQKLSYLGVIFLLLPLLLLSGLAMSPAMDAAWPWLLDIFGGRQSARSVHFICAMLMVLFIFVHLVMVTLAGPFNEIRSMITGRIAVPAEGGSRG